MPASSTSRSRSAAMAGSSTALRLLALLHRERDAGAGDAGQRLAGGAAARWFDLQHVGPEVGEQPADAVGVGAAQVQHPHGREQSAHRVSSRSTHSSWASVPVTTYIKSTKASGYPLSASDRTVSAT